MSKIKFQTREEWLVKAAHLMAGLFESHDYKIPEVRVSCGWPSRGGLANGKRTIGQCWSPDAASDKIAQIFISPYILDEGPQGVLPTLVHEVVHAVVGTEAKHGKKFKDCALAVGLEGKMTATHAGEDLEYIIDRWRRESLGAYPHSKLDPKKSPVPKQSTRMIKMECGECGYIARTSQKWIDAVGPCECPAGHGLTTVDV